MGRRESGETCRACVRSRPIFAPCHQTVKVESSSDGDIVDQRGYLCSSHAWHECKGLRWSSNGSAAPVCAWSASWLPPHPRMPERLACGRPCRTHAGGGRAGYASPHSAPLCHVLQGATDWGGAPPSPDVCRPERGRRGESPAWCGAGRARLTCVSPIVTSGVTLRSALLRSRMRIPRWCGPCPDAPGQRPPPGMWTRGHHSAQGEWVTTASTREEREECALASGLTQN